MKGYFRAPLRLAQVEILKHDPVCREEAVT